MPSVKSFYEGVRKIVIIAVQLFCPVHQCIKLLALIDAYFLNGCNTALETLAMYWPYKHVWPIYDFNFCWLFGHMIGHILMHKLVICLAILYDEADMRWLYDWSYK